jgi:hypothetical protein
MSRDQPFHECGEFAIRADRNASPAAFHAANDGFAGHVGRHG